MIQVPGEVLSETLSGRPFPLLRASVGPYDGSVAGDYEGTSDLARDVLGLEVTLPDPDDPHGATESRAEYVVADLTDRLVGIGAISHRIPLLADSLESSELVIEISNPDGAFSPIETGTPGSSRPHQLLRMNRQLGAVLRIEAGGRDVDGVPHYFPVFEGVVRSSIEADGRVTWKARDPIDELNRITLPASSPTYTAKSAAYIVRDLWENYTSESETLGRPLLHIPDFDAADAVSPVPLTITDAGEAHLRSLPLGEAMALVARHGFAAVWIDGRRRLRFTMREVGETFSDFRLDADRNLISGSLAVDLSAMANKVTGTYGASTTAFTTQENEESQARYGIREIALDLPLISTLAGANAYARRYLIEFAWPILTYTATADLSALVLEPGDWARANDPKNGIGGLRFQVFAVDYDPGSRSVGLTMHNTDPSITEGGAFTVGISKIDSGDAFL